MFTAKNNSSALIGAALATIAVFVLDALLKFFVSGQPWPIDGQGWAQVIVPALCAGLSAVLLPHYSLSEARTGVRIVDSARDGDAPVIDKNPAIAIITDLPNDQPSVPGAPPGLPPH